MENIMITTIVILLGFTSQLAATGINLYLINPSEYIFYLISFGQLRHLNFDIALSLQVQGQGSELV